jgi:hypothetical protein
VPITLDKIPLHLIAAASTGNLVPFIGAGVSRQATFKGSKNHLPTWIELIQELLQLARLGDFISEPDDTEIDKLLAQGKYLMVAEFLRSALPQAEFELYVRKRFDTLNMEVGMIHHALFKLRCPLIITTNYDLLLEKAYAQKFAEYPRVSSYPHIDHVAYVLKFHATEEEKPILFHLHGTSADPANIVFGEMDYRTLYRDARYRLVLTTTFLTKVVLMLGFSFTDPDLTELIGSLRHLLRGASPDYIFLPHSEKSRIEKLALRRYGLELIGYEPTDGHPELAELVEYLSGFAPRNLARTKVNR